MMAPSVSMAATASSRERSFRQGFMGYHLLSSHSMGKRRKNELSAGQQKSRVIGTRRGSAHRGRKQDGDRRQEQHPGSGEQQEAPPEPASGAGEGVPLHQAVSQPEGEAESGQGGKG